MFIIIFLMSRLALRAHRRKRKDDNFSLMDLLGDLVTVSPIIKDDGIDEKKTDFVSVDDLLTRTGQDRDDVKNATSDENFDVLSMLFDSKPSKSDAKVTTVDDLLDYLSAPAKSRVSK